MPIGKNSIKRVANNGYSKVKSTAPDMENSSVIANPAPEVIEKMIPSSKKIAAAKNASAPTKSTAPTKKTTTKAAPKKEKEPAAKQEKQETVNYIAIGKEMPIYLL